MPRPFGSRIVLTPELRQQLQTLVRTALEQNYDLQIAASRILQARA